MNLKFLLLITLMSFCTKEQHIINDNVQREKVKINNWGERLLIMTDDFWESAAEKLVPQYGKEVFLKIKNLSTRSKVPCQMQLICEDINGSARKDIGSHYAKLSRLTLYKVVTFPYKHLDGTVHDYVVAEVPYEENKDWDATAKWDTIFFVFPANEVQDIK